MVLPRSLSSSSWHVPSTSQTGGEDDEHIPDQRRLRHLSSILIRNLTLNPRRDHLSSLLHGPLPTPSVLVPSTTASPSRPRCAADDTDLYFRSKRRRAKSNASLTGSDRPIPSEWTTEQLDPSLNGGSTSAVVGSSSKARTRPRRSSSGATLGIREEAEPPSPLLVHLPPEDDDDDATRAKDASSRTLTTVMKRHRSASRASIASVATTASGSTIRQSSMQPGAAGTRFDDRPDPAQAPSTSKAPPPRETTRTSYTSEAQLAKEKDRRAETLRRRLVDSAITLSLVPATDLTSAGDARQRAGSLRGKMTRSDSSSSVLLSNSGSNSPRRPTGRSRTLSTPVVPSVDAPPTPPERPFFISKPARQTMHPTFAFERDKFLVGDDEDPMRWCGLREGRVLVRVWTRASEGKDGKGKEKATSEDGLGGDWKLLVEWDVAFDGLVSLGRDPTQFPSLPPNTLIFALSDEYFTAAPSSRTSRQRFFPATTTIASDESGSDLSDDAGNQSDPGAGTVSLRSRRRRRELEEEQEAARRRRRAVVEKSKRETRMVQSVGIEGILRARDVERERDEILAEVATVKSRVEQELGGDAGFPALQREANEVQDRLDDLIAVRADLQLDIDEARDALAVRAEALRLRRARLKAVRELDDRNRALMTRQNSDMFEDEASISTIRQASQSRRTQLITLLSHIFPIEAALPPSSSDPSSHLLFSIVDLALPNSTYPPSFSDDSLSSALGYTAQVVSLLAAYLGVPLHYPIKCLGSRSAVVDMISMMRGPRAFPLYGRGVDRYRFDYGVFLLNKNIEQLIYAHQGETIVHITDLRNTLPNLKSLILTLSYDSSHSEFPSSSLTAIPADFAISRSPSPSLSATSSDELAHSSPPTSTSNDGDDRRDPSSLHGALSLTDALARTDDDGSTPASPSTIKALSIRSSSPVPTLTGDATPSNGTSTSKSKNGSKTKKSGAVEAKVGIEKARSRASAQGSRIASSLWTAVGYGPTMTPTKAATGE